MVREMLEMLELLGQIKDVRKRWKMEDEERAGVVARAGRNHARKLGVGDEVNGMAVVVMSGVVWARTPLRRLLLALGMRMLHRGLLVHS